MHILIVEDEPFVVEDLKDKLNQLGYRKLETVDNVPKAIDLINNSPKPFDVALVDIELNGDQDGIELGAFLSKQNIPFIYLSDLQDIPTFNRAQKTNPQMNIPKPIGLLQLRNCLLELPAKMTSQSKHILVACNGKRTKINRDDIIKLTASRNDCEIWTPEKRYVASSTMGRVIEILNDERFIRVHRSHVVNLDFVTHFQGNMITLRDYDDTVQLSDSYRSQFIQSFDTL